MDLALSIVQYAISGGWTLLWVVALCLGIWQILRKRTIAGLCLGLAALFGLLGLGTSGLFQRISEPLSAAVGYQVADILLSFTRGLLDALPLLLLIAAAVVQRPRPLVVPANAAELPRS